MSRAQLFTPPSALLHNVWLQNDVSLCQLYLPFQMNTGVKLGINCQPKSDVRFQIGKRYLVSELQRVLSLSQGTTVITTVGSHCYSRVFQLYSKRSNQYQSKTQVQGVQLVGEWFITIYEIQGSISSSAEQNQTTITPQMLQMEEDTSWLQDSEHRHQVLANWYKSGSTMLQKMAFLCLFLPVASFVKQAISLVDFLLVGRLVYVSYHTHPSLSVQTCKAPHAAGRYKAQVSCVSIRGLLMSGWLCEY